jgi:hypothetical protein
VEENLFAGSIGIYLQDSVAVVGGLFVSSFSKSFVAGFFSID